MNPLLNDDELAEAMRRFEISDPLPGVDPATLVTRGRRGLRRRRLLATGGVAALVSAIAVSATILPDLGSGNPSPAATSSASAGKVTTQDYLSPMPGVSRGDAALAMISKAEAERRCAVRDPGRGAVENGLAAFYRGGANLEYAKPPQNVRQPLACQVPGDSRPTAAGLAVLRSQRLPRDDAGLLRNCSIMMWHDLRSWRIAAKDAAPGLVTSLVAVSPSSQYVAQCRLTADGTDGGSGTGIRPVKQTNPTKRPLPSAMEQLQYLGSSGTACPVFGVRCAGSALYEMGRTDPKVAKLRFVSTDGSHHDVTVQDGWYALAWNDKTGHPGFGGHMTAYDKFGKVLHTH